MESYRVFAPSVTVLRVIVLPKPVWKRIVDTFTLITLTLEYARLVTVRFVPTASVNDRAEVDK